MSDGALTLKEYQSTARKTQQKPDADVPPVIIPLLGLAGEAGDLLSEYKKHLRDGAAHRLFKDRIAEELGDVLWYVSDIASRFDLYLDDIAQANLVKVEKRWSSGHVQSTPLFFDDEFPTTEQLPRRCIATFTMIDVDGKPMAQLAIDGVPTGDPLTDNAYDDDGYRFHDVIHLAFMAVLGWSPVMRKIMKRKRKSDGDKDVVEDGARARVVEETVSAFVFSYAADHAFLDGVKSLDYDLLRSIQVMTCGREVDVRTPAEWEHAITLALETWRKIDANDGGKVLIDMNQRFIGFVE
jgi:NTP pyrophosphatase (non-canonical NTP hydrolase)